MGVLHPDHLERDLSRSQWLGWLAWLKVRGPIGPDRYDFYASYTAFNARIAPHAGLKGEVSLDDFAMPWRNLAEELALKSEGEEEEEADG